MDVFGTIKNGIDIARDVWTLLEGIRDAPETLSRLVDEVRSMGCLLEECGKVFDSSPEMRTKFYPLLQNAEQALRRLQLFVSRYQKKVTSSGVLSTRIAFRVHQNEAKLQAFSRDIQHHKLSLNLFCT